MNREDVSQWIKRARASRGWRQEDLGEALGVTKANVSHWETGKHEPSFLQLLRIRDVTGMALVEVESAGAWPLPTVRREQITALTDQQRQQLDAGVAALLVAITHATAADVLSASSQSVRIHTPSEG
jgi:transcriptional regulator with XRE-family HTH domain